VLFLIYYFSSVSFVLYFIVLALAVPVIALQLIGPSIAIVLSVFTFGALFPRFSALVSACVLFPFALLYTNPQQHAIDLNSASFDELCLLPGVGPVTARGITECRPFRDLEDLEARVPSFRSGTSWITDLIRFSECVRDSVVDA
jgi:hypothetical protein